MCKSVCNNTNILKSKWWKIFHGRALIFFLLSFLSNVIVSKETQRVLKIPNGLLIEDYCQYFSSLIGKLWLDFIVTLILSQQLTYLKLQVVESNSEKKMTCLGEICLQLVVVKGASYKGWINAFWKSVANGLEWYM